MKRTITTVRMRIRACPPVFTLTGSGPLPNLEVSVGNWGLLQTLLREAGYGGVRRELWVQSSSRGHRGEKGDLTKDREISWVEEWGRVSLGSRET
jgi:hypothetical protein